MIFFYNRNDHKPQPKPRLSLVKTTNKDLESITSQVNSSIVQRIKPFFEQQSIISSQEPKFIKQRQPVSIPYTYQTGNPTKATCLDDIISSKVCICKILEKVNIDYFLLENIHHITTTCSTPTTDGNIHQ